MTAMRDDYDKPHVLCTAVDSSDDDDKFITGKKNIYRILQVLGPNGESIQSQPTTVVSKVYNLINLYYVCGMLPFTTRPQNGLTKDRTLNLYLGLKANSLTTYYKLLIRTTSILSPQGDITIDNNNHDYLNFLTYLRNSKQLVKNGRDYRRLSFLKTLI